eukprot:TRINITY_DN33328_c0_g1_i1.p1 TRINITY_DN33328_c0_g1~~TRINITY_DN33328_c0_g1_i1.p1  ORF type:complete len:969 (+),score=9.90 TRINITY_DN33328_c0_g1_i1:298-3204(+)
MGDGGRRETRAVRPGSVFWVVLFLVGFGCVSSVQGATADVGDAAVLEAMAKSLKGLDWSGLEPCDWGGVTCDSSGKVKGINIQGMGVTGTLPADFNNLTALTTLSMQHNNISGPLPSFRGMQNLQSVYLGQNSFESIPADFFDGLSNLQIFSIENNENLAPWVIPDGLQAAAVLQEFYANNANIQGLIPEFLGNGSMASLQQLWLAFNNLSGGIPVSFNASQIVNLRLNNQNGRLLGGRIDVVGRMQSLTHLSLHVNAFTGPIPDFVSEGLSVLELRDNQLTGPVPESLQKSDSLSNISLKNNDLQGPAPQFRAGVDVDDGGNNYCTAQPGKGCDGRVQALLDFAGAVGYPLFLSTGWTGNDPCASWQYVSCRGGNITVLNLANRGLNGTISPALGRLTSLTEILLNNNNLSGTIPADLAGLPNLSKLDLRNNNLHGSVPKFASSVQVLTAGNARIGQSASPQGSPSPSDGDNTSDSGSGGGTGKGKTAGASGGSTKASSNGRSGGIIAGAVLGSLVLLLGVFAASFLLYRRCRRSNRVQSPNSAVIAVANRPGTDGSVSARELLKVSIAPTGGSDTLSRSSNNSGPSSDVPAMDGGGSSMVISIQVLREVTNGFSDRNILGCGGFGVVYRGELHDGTKIAVKRMESVAVSSKGLREFQAEIAVLTKVRHRHLVALLGYCIEGNERLLVYEYVPQGPLSRHLFEWREAGLRPLDWKQRLIIALDVARGVEYLHSLAHKSFIHRDLKPSNILLGDDLRAKVSDFGLVKLAPEGKYSVETKLAGTFGYLAPEYAVTGRVTTKVDVFSFGVVLMELITGRRALDESQPEESVHLVTWFRRCMGSRDAFIKALDPVLLADEESGNRSETLQSINKVAELAGHCTAREPLQRPDMGHAVNVLAPLVEQWKPADTDADDCYGIDLDLPLPQALKRWQAFDDDEDEDGGFDSLTQASIPNKPSGFAESFTSADCR